MRISVDYPSTLPDALQRTPQEFEQEAKMAMAAKLYELKRVSSGTAAQMAGVSRVQFLSDLHRYGVATIDLSTTDLDADLANA